PSERVNGDMLALIDESGRRYLFAYSVSASQFVSDPKGGLIQATVSVEPDGPSSKNRAGDGSYFPYRLVKHDNLRYYFNAAGQLARIEDLRGDALIVSRDSAGHAMSVSDSYGR